MAYNHHQSFDEIRYCLLNYLMVEFIIKNYVQYLTVFSVFILINDSDYSESDILNICNHIPFS